MTVESQRTDAGRAEKLRQVRERVRNGSSMVRRLTPVNRAAQASRELRRKWPR